MKFFVITIAFILKSFVVIWSYVGIKGGDVNVDYISMKYSML